MFSRKPRPTGLISGLFLLFYGIFRFVVEFAREPDAHIGFDWQGWMTRGQLLSVPMIVGGVVLVIASLMWARHNRKAT
jgi:phosphatidylglycerol:prolipoprotein diacylglycerol transferase